MLRPNIILFHLESLNYLQFSCFRDYLPNLKALLYDSTLYNKYYSSATSTHMTITDLIFQDTRMFEKSNYLEDIFSIDFVSGSRLTDDLSKKGYQIKISYYEKNADFDEKEFLRFCDILAENPNTYLANSIDELLDDFVQYISSTSAPYFFYFQDIESHIGQLPYVGHGENLSNRQLYLERYICLDNSIGKLIKILKKINVYDNTAIVLYGDHGDELWGHGLHQGYMHAYEPYNNMIHCPLIVHYPGQQSGMLDQTLLSTLDIGSIILQIADSDVINIRKSDIVYSRNLFAAQKNNINIFNKSYSASDGNYILIVTEQGFKMYFNFIDPFSARNILDFFVLSNGMLKYNSIFKYMRSSHYKSFMTDAQIAEIKDAFIVLKEKLHNFVEYCYADKQYEMQFNKIAYSYDIKKSMFYIIYSGCLNILQRIIKKAYNKIKIF
ncbi:MAG: sulfatase-like hydrolase/transferase [Treponema sp.]|uniref:sulfatase-like hydrolase/transferase n=1 Tax=Treponema sp. TaxID=166 RepID=UPI003FA27609